MIIPDSTRTAPIALMSAILGEILGPEVEALDYLVALGTHPAMDDAALSRLLGREVINGRAGGSRVFNHRWEDPETFVTLGTITASEVAAATGGRLEMDVPVRLNRLLGEPDRRSPYDRVIVCGPVFPHEVAGFSGGNKYFVPESPGGDHRRHPLGGGAADQPGDHRHHRHAGPAIDRSCSFVHPDATLPDGPGDARRGPARPLVGGMEEAWRAAASSRPSSTSSSSTALRAGAVGDAQMYDDLWTGAKGMYKLEPASPTAARS